MNKLKDVADTSQYRDQLIHFLNEYGLNGMAILAMTRKAEGHTCAPGEIIVEQGKRSKHIFFLLTGIVQIYVKEMGQVKSMGERGAVTMLGEIAYFNKTPATATVSVSGKSPAVVFRLSYREFGEIIERYPDVKGVLARIGDMRVIRQFHGFIPFRMFMDMIGWRKDRFAVNRAFAEYLENGINLAFKPLLKKDAKILEVGDGPGLASEMLYGSDHLRHLAVPRSIDSFSQ